jgi:hypothetical protein
MFSKLREPFGKAGLIVAIIALVAALGGGAYAASGGLNGKQKKEVKAIAKHFAGKRGPQGKRGKNGQNGQNGANGAPGAKGDTGAAGTNGTNGTPGASGKSVEATEIAAAPGEPCEEQGGAFYEVEGSGVPTEICNGKEGSPWSVGGLPQGATETGTWTVSASPAIANEEGEVYAPISFSVPLREPLEFATGKVHYVPFLGEAPCEGNAAEPSAPEGELCIYESEKHGLSFLNTVDMEFAPNAASKSGTVLVFNEVQEHAWAFGSWAVTGE